MDLLYRLKQSPEKFDILEDIKLQIKPILFNVINNIKFTDSGIIKIEDSTLPKIKLSDFYSKEEQNNNIIHLSNYLYTNLKSNNYDKFISNFTPIFILETIIYNYKKKNIISFIYRSNKLVFHCYFRNNCDYMDILIKAVKSFTFLEYCKIKNQEINIYYANTKFKKKLPKYKILGPNSVNSGLTSKNRLLDSKYITIFRKEESDKVLLHEIVHYLEMEFSDLNESNRVINQIILNDFNVNQDSRYINFFESYTDSIAIIFNSIFNSILTDKSISDYYYTEIDHIEKIIIKILSFFNIKSLDSLFDKNTKNKLVQNTSVLSYYILKLGLLRDPEHLLKYYFPLKYNDWNLNKIINLYKFTKKNLNTDKKDYEPNNNSLRMSYNQLVCNI